MRSKRGVAFGGNVCVCFSGWVGRRYKIEIMYIRIIFTSLLLCVYNTVVLYTTKVRKSMHE